MGSASSYQAVQAVAPGQLELVRKGELVAGVK